MTDVNLDAAADAPDVRGLHHVTAITGSAQRNHDFYVHGLGLRLVKQTVNFDDPGAWHLYYADGAGSPGSVMTFFAWPGGRAGRQGAGQVAVTQFAVPPGALPFWRERLAAEGAELASEPESPFGEPRILFSDPDGLRLALVETPDPRAPWTTDAVGPEHAVRGFHGVTLALREGETTARILEAAFGYVETESAPAGGGRVTRWRRPDGVAGVVDLHVDPAMRAGREGVGAVHHVAFSVPDPAAQARVREALADLGLQVTPPIDRQYFQAIYARTPGGVLFEVATETPGFAVDEPVERLGAALRLPARYEAHRARIEAALPPLGV